MRYIYLLFLCCAILIVPAVSSAQNDTVSIKKDSSKIDTVSKLNVDTAVVATPMNCYKQYVDYFTELGAKPVTDGMQPIVLAFKSKESCHCFMGRVQVTGGKIVAPLYVQTEGGEYKTFSELSPNIKLDPEFLEAVGNDLWSIANGMSVVFQTTEKAYGRVFFYKSLNKSKGVMNKEAPSPADLVK